MGKSGEIFERRFLGSFAKLQKTVISFVMSVYPTAGKNSDPTGWTLVKFVICLLLEYLSIKFTFL